MRSFGWPLVAAAAMLAAAFGLGWVGLLALVEGWDPNAITFADFSTLGNTVTGIFLNTNNTVYATSFGLHSVLMWPEGSVNATQSIFTNLISPEQYLCHLQRRCLC